MRNFPDSPLFVYLYHFDRPYRHTQHYLGYTSIGIERHNRHMAGRGAKLLNAVKEAGIEFTIVRVWQVESKEEGRQLELKLKKQRNHKRFCPVCKEEK